MEDATLRVVDGVLEDIRLGLELNWPKMNQRRVSGVKFLGELYNYQLVESNVIFRTLYLLISFGCNPDGSASPLDPYDSYFRVRLVCILLDTCGQYFDRGSSKKRLDVYLVFFQCYLFSKRQPLPLEVEHLVLDTMEALRPGLDLLPSAQEAYQAAVELERKYKDKLGDLGQEGGSEGEEEEDDDDEEEEERGGRGGQEGEEDGEQDGEDDNAEDEPMEGQETEGLSQPDQSDDEPEPVLKTGPTLIPCQEDDEFAAAFEKMMTEDLQSRRGENVKVPVMDTGVPLQLIGGALKNKSAEPLVHEDGEIKMKFKVMSRKGHKQQLKELNIPIDSGLAASLRDTQQALKDEHREMKKLVLDHERRQEEEEYQAMVAQERLQMLQRQGKKQDQHKPQQRKQPQQQNQPQAARQPHPQQQAARQPHPQQQAPKQPHPQQQAPRQPHPQQQASRQSHPQQRGPRQRQHKQQRYSDQQEGH